MPYRQISKPRSISQFQLHVYVHYLTLRMSYFEFEMYGGIYINDKILLQLAGHSYAIIVITLKFSHPYV
uniref:Uncharacterized protein n=1 Tax=Rhizophora mucronata TaxID=61149 RepID=A0A2P2PVK8_RHIMU